MDSDQFSALEKSLDEIASYMQNQVSIRAGINTLTKQMEDVTAVLKEIVRNIGETTENK